MKHIEKYVIVALIILSVLFTLGSFGFKYLTNRVKVSVEESKQAEMINELIEVDPTILPEGTVYSDPLDKTIKKIISLKYKVNIKDITVEELQSDGIYSRGTYSIANSDTKNSYIAQYKKDSWDVLYEGSYDKTPCSLLETASYPFFLMPDCFNEKTQTLESRITF